MTSLPTGEPESRDAAAPREPLSPFPRPCGVFEGGVPEEGGATSRAERPPRGCPAEGLRVLVVEDDPVVLLLLRRVLEGRGHAVEAFDSGETAWDALQRAAYPLILLDWMLPGLDGLELCRRLRASPEGARSVVLMVTQRDAAEDLEAALRAGVDDYLLKPLDLRAVRVRLELAERRARGLERELRLEAEAASARRALAQSERRYRELFERMIDGFALHEILCDDEGRPVDYRFLEVNPAFEWMTGLTRDEVLGRTVLEVLPGTEPHWIRRYGDVALGGRSVRFEEYSAALGRHFEVVAFRPAPGQFAVHFVDVTERVAAEDGLRRSEERLKAAVNSLPVMLYAFDAAGRVVFWNRECERVTGFGAEEIVGTNRPLESFCPDPDCWSRSSSAGVRGEDFTERRECTLRCKDGTSRRVAWTDLTARAAVPGWSRWGVGIDVTEHRRLEGQLLQSQKMEAVGRLAGGVAHDFNNLLTAILGYCDLIAQSGSVDDPVRRDVEEIRKAGQRAALLTQQLLAFSRKQVPQSSVLDLNEVTQDLAKMLHRLIGEDVALEIACAPEPARVRADLGQLQQVLLNLAVNARDAMPRGGSLRISVALCAPPQDLEGFAEDGECVRLAVADTGAGIAEAVLPHIFEPFFTTKEPGSGTGLGLATVRAAVLQSGGGVRVRSRVGEGTVFEVYLPRAEAEPTHASLDEAPASCAGGDETVLLVEDSEGVLELATAVLSASGYRVLTASTPEGALAVAAEAAGRIDLLLTDVVLPGMNGPALAERLGAGMPGLKVLFMTGYTHEALVRQGPLEPDARLLQKPFRAQALTRAVREALDA